MRVSDTVVELVGAWDSKSRSRKRVVVPAGLEPADPYGIRTRVAAVKGQCPRPLDEAFVLPLNNALN